MYVLLKNAGHRLYGNGDVKTCHLSSVYLGKSRISCFNTLRWTNFQKSEILIHNPKLTEKTQIQLQGLIAILQVNAHNL